MPRKRTKSELKAIHAKGSKTKESRFVYDYNDLTRAEKEAFIKKHNIRTNEDLDEVLNKNLPLKKESVKTHNSFMTYKEYNRKQKELQEKIKEANRSSDFAYSNMGRVDVGAEKRQKRLIEESHELQKKGEAHYKKHPEWIKQ